MKTIDVSHLVERLEIRKDEIEYESALLGTAPKTVLRSPDLYLDIRFRPGTSLELVDLLGEVINTQEVVRLVTPGGSVTAQFSEVPVYHWADARFLIHSRSVR